MKHVDTEMKIYAGHLSKIDKQVHRYLRDLLHLPNDTLSCAFYNPVKYGGMGLPCLRWTIPVLVLRRLLAENTKIISLLTALNGT